TADVGSVADALACPGEGHRRLTVQGVASGRDIQLGLGSVQVFFETHRHTTDGIDHLLHPGHVHDHEVVHVDVGHVLEGTNGARSGIGHVAAFASESERHVPHAIIVVPPHSSGACVSGAPVGQRATGDLLQHQVTRDGHHVHPAAVGGDVHQQGGVRAHAGHITPADGLVLLAFTRVRPHHQDVVLIACVRIVRVGRGPVRTIRAHDGVHVV